MDAKQAGNLGHGFAVPLDELPGMGDLFGREERYVTLPADYDTIRAHILDAATPH